MNLHLDPVALRAVLRAHKRERSYPFTSNERLRVIDSYITEIETTLDHLCGDHDCKTPEAWRKVN